MKQAIRLTVMSEIIVTYRAFVLVFPSIIVKTPYLTALVMSAVASRTSPKMSF